MNVSAAPAFEITTESFGPKAARYELSIAIPAKDEEERIVSCLDAIAAQAGIDFSSLVVVILLNNCRDGSLAAIRRFAGPGLSFRLVAASVELPLRYANAGWARRLAMEQASALTGDSGHIVTTDADSVAAPNWLAEIEREFALGVDAVAGFVTADWDELSRLPAEVLAQGADEWTYQTLAAELEAKADPVPHDPWPRHNQNCGASTAIRASLYRDLGGLIPVPVGEDRALFDAVRVGDGLIRHSLAAHVTASARTTGRASGGMADALKTRGSAVYECDEILEPAMATLRRNAWRHEARAAWVEGRLAEWMRRRKIAAPSVAAGPNPAFWPAWVEIERQDIRLGRTRLRSDDLPFELRRIRKLLRLISGKAGIAQG